MTFEVDHHDLFQKMTSVVGHHFDLFTLITLPFQFCVVIVVVFIIEVIAGVMAFFFLEYVRETLLKYMNQAMTTYQDDADLKSAMDYIQKRVSSSHNIRDLCLCTDYMCKDCL